MRFVSLVALSTAALALMGCPSESAPADTDKLPSLQSPAVITKSRREVRSSAGSRWRWASAAA